MKSNALKQLERHVDLKYKLFMENLVPGEENIIGVRVPIIRQLAKKLVKETNWVQYLQSVRPTIHEEILLQGFIIQYAKITDEDRLHYATKHIPLLQNWATCDSFCSTLKLAKTKPDLMWAFIKPYFQSKNVYELRFAIVMGIYFVETEYIDSLFRYLNAIQSDYYYVKMAIAWTVSIAYIRNEQQTAPFLLNNELDLFTHNKAIQKITESNTLTASQKAVVRQYKR
jgi:3-methyladenine DNA glycosylase AlkD